MTRLTIYSDGPAFPALPGAIITREQLRLEELEHPERFGPEYEGQWANVLNAYLNREHIARLFEPWHGEALISQTVATNNREYYAHADPGRSGANFALVIAHVEHDDGPDPHVVIDLIRVWRPRDFPSHEINYVQVEGEIFKYIKAFQIRALTFDQWNSAGTIDHLRERVRGAGFWWRTEISERTATAPSNWAEAENFKTALLKNLVHSPYLELAEQELLFLEWDGHQKVHPPASGPCTTSDIADCLFAVTHVILDGRFDPSLGLRSFPLHGAFSGGLPIDAADRATFERLADFRARPARHAPRQPERGRTWRPRSYRFR